MRSRTSVSGRYGQAGTLQKVPGPGVSAYDVVRKVRRRRGVGRRDLRMRRALLVGGGEVVQVRPLQPCYRLGLR